MVNLGAWTTVSEAGSLVLAVRFVRTIVNTSDAHCLPLDQRMRVRVRMMMLQWVYLPVGVVVRAMCRIGT